MRFKDFRALFAEQWYVCTDWIYRYVTDFDKRRLVERTDKWYLVPLKRGRYLFDDAPKHRDLLYHLAWRLYVPSYISLQAALSWWQLIPETTMTITSISSKKTTSFDTSIANRSYRSTKPHCLVWYQVQHSAYGSFAMATREKALADLLYFFPQYGDEKAFEALRLDAEQLSRDFLPEIFLHYVALFEQKKLQRTAQHFISFLNHA